MYTFNDPVFQKGLVKLFERETADPRWEEFAEDTDYDDYYEELSDLSQQVAQKSNEAEAWRALVYSAYNPSSTFGRWLIAQPQTLPFFLEMIHSSNSWVWGQGAEMLAEMIEYCSDPKTRNCSPELKAKRSEILTFIRREVVSAREPGQAILALGICGSVPDIAILEQRAAALRADNIEANDKRALSDRESSLRLIQMAQQQISDRTH